MNLVIAGKAVGSMGEAGEHNEKILELLLETRREAAELLATFERDVQTQRHYIEKLDDTIAGVRNWPSPAAGHVHPLFGTSGPGHPSVIQDSRSGNEAGKGIEVLNSGKRKRGRPRLEPSREGPKRPRNFTPGSNTYNVIKCMHELIDRVGRPVSKREVIDGLAADGTPLNVADQLHFVQKALWKSGRYRYLEGSDAWWPVDRDIPES